MRELAARLGYDLAEIVVYDRVSVRPPLARLKAQATRLDAEAVIVPGLAHLVDSQIPVSLVRQLDVITVHPEATYSRSASPVLPILPPVAARDDRRGTFD
ncbi:hypothetical protein [Nocardia sp. NPDC020380]|uniref:hypothetical protein n=1 Tax=Nocardia sp. NPDC020380 TaxID=3364309 RepID=UPI0037A9ECA3